LSYTETQPHEILPHDTLPQGAKKRWKDEREVYSGDKE
jgi:hypothetical protein